MRSGRDSVLTGCPAGHPTAAFGAFAADSGAVFHPLDLLAALRAGLADFSTDFADPLGESRTAQHEVGRGLAHLRAVQHEAEMVGRDMLTARFQTMVHCFVQTCLVASITGIDACLHLGVGSVSHGKSPLSWYTVHSSWAEACNQQISPIESPERLKKSVRRRT